MIVKQTDTQDAGWEPPVMSTPIRKLPQSHESPGASPIIVVGGDELACSQTGQRRYPGDPGDWLDIMEPSGWTTNPTEAKSSNGGQLDADLGQLEKSIIGFEVNGVHSQLSPWHKNIFRQAHHKGGRDNRNEGSRHREDSYDDVCLWRAGGIRSRHLYWTGHTAIL